MGKIIVEATYHSKQELLDEILLLILDFNAERVGNQYYPLTDYEKGLLMEFMKSVIDSKRTNPDSWKEALSQIAAVLDLKLPEPEHVDPVQAIIVDIHRLLDVQKLWSQACDIARSNCPVSVGLSHIRDGIPKLRRERDELQREVEELRKRLVEKS